MTRVRIQSVEDEGVTDQWWRRITAHVNGGQYEGIPGRKLGPAIKITFGTSFTTGPLTTEIEVDLIGGGGGAYAFKTFAVTPSTTYTIAIGAGGTGGTGAGGTGGTGGNTTVTVGATTVTAPGGLGGMGMVAGGIANTVAGGGGQLSTNGDINSQGWPGDASLRLTSTVSNGGSGGSSPYGGGGLGPATASTGVAGGGFGGGGSGGVVEGGSGAEVGGAGSQGMILIREFSGT